MKEKFLKKYLLFLIVLTFAQFLSNKAISEYSIYIQWFVLFLSIIITFFYRSYLFSSNLYLRTYIFLFILFPWLSVIPGYYSHGQTLYQSAFVLSTYSLVFIFYFIFLKYKISETLFINVLIVFAIVYTFLELFQQLTYPNYWFSGREVMETTGDLEIRLGLYKFYMTGINLVILAAFYCWDRLLKNFNKRLLYLFIFLIIGIYAFLARKMDFSFIICIAISYFLTKKRKWYYGFLILTFFSLLYLYSDKIFGDFIEKTQSELSDDDFIRFQSMGFYLNYFDDPLTLILGNSREYGDSALSY
jgi:hypothetical protein